MIRFFVFFALASGALGENWPQFLGIHSNRTTNEVVPPWGKDGPREIWKVPTHTGFSSFTVAEGMAFTLVRMEEDGIELEACVGLDAKTGETKWQTPLTLMKLDGGGGDAGAEGNKGGDGPRSTPSFSDGKVYTLNNDLGLHCLDAQSGNVLWKKDILAEFGGRNIKWENAASPLVFEGGVYVIGGGPGQSMICFDKSDGSVLWKNHDYKMTHATPVAAFIHGQAQVIFFTQAGLVACEPATGEELWKYEFPFRVSTAASPVVFEDIVYCAAGYGVGAGACRVKKLANGFAAEEIWRIEGDEPVCNHWSTPVVKDGYLYGMFSFKKYGSGPVKCVDIRTGEVKWEKAGFGPGGITLAQNCLVALSDIGEVVLIEVNDSRYRELARYDAIDGKCWSSPSISNGRIYVRSTTEGACLDVAAAAR